MHTELGLGTPVLLGFLLVLARMAGVATFVPIPGLRSGPDSARIVLSLALTFALMSVWPAPQVEPSLGVFTLWIASEFAFGVAAGLVVALLLEGFLVAAQIIGLQAGYSFASTIDPNTQADSGLLPQFAQLAAGVLFLTLGLDREMIGVLAENLRKSPPGSFHLTAAMGEGIVRLGAEMFHLGLRLALPVIALLLLLDIALAVASRLQPQLQLLSLAFPVKTLAGLAILALILRSMSELYPDCAAKSLSLLRGLAGT